MKLTFTDAQQAEISKLRAMAIEKYEVDGGEMYECFDGADYGEAILNRGTAEAAWAMHMRVLDARRESCGWNEAQAEIKAFGMTPEEVAEMAKYFPSTAKRGAAGLDNQSLCNRDSQIPEQLEDDADYERELDRSRNVNHFWAGAGTNNMPESAAHCEFGQIEYDWHLSQAGM